MPRANPMQVSFSSGELSPRMAGRVDQARYASGCHAMRGFIPDIAGPAIKRGGTRYCAETKDSADRAWLVRFELSATDAYILEFGDLYIRFYNLRAPVLSLGVPYEIVTPYTADDLVNDDGGFAISYVQSGDIIYLTHRDYAPRKLSRYSSTNWTLTTYTPDGGPFQDVNATSTTVYASANTGAITLHASAATFTTDDVGTLFYLEQKTVSDVKQWEPGKAVVLNDIRRSGGRNYKALNSATTGTVTPTHTEGSVYDGDAGVQWEFLDAGYGWATITAYTSTAQVSATVVSRIPDGAVGVGNPSTKWARGAWSDALGWPDTVTFYLDRLVFGREQQIWMSVAGDYENMQARDFGQQLTTSAVSLPLPSRRGNPILWLETLEVGLVAGTGADEWLIGPASRNDPFGPLNVAPVPLGSIGSRGITPVRLFDSIVFAQRSGRRLRDLRYLQGDGALRADLNAFADHITTGFVSLAYTAEPYSLIYGVGTDGALSACTYYPEQEVLGWTNQAINGDVECVTTIPSPDGLMDDLWMIVRRTIDGATKRYVEWMSAPLTDSDDQENAHYVDSGIVYDGAATATITGLDHLEGEMVNVLVNGATHPPRTVSSGSITLQQSATVAHVGLSYSAVLASMDIEAGAAAGTAQGKPKRVHRGFVRLHRTLGGAAGPAEDKVDTLQFRTSSVAMGSPPPLFTGDKGIAWPGGTDRQARVWFVHEDPTPCTVVAFMPEIETAG